VLNMIDNHSTKMLNDEAGKKNEIERIGYDAVDDFDAGADYERVKYKDIDAAERAINRLLGNGAKSADNEKYIYFRPGAWFQLDGEAEIKKKGQFWKWKSEVENKPQTFNLRISGFDPSTQKLQFTGGLSISVKKFMAGLLANNPDTLKTGGDSIVSYSFYFILFSCLIIQHLCRMIVYHI